MIKKSICCLGIYALMFHPLVAAQNQNSTAADKSSAESRGIDIFSTT
jgi:hypothetical protein